MYGKRAVKSSIRVLLFCTSVLYLQSQYVEWDEEHI